jgi:DNA-binding NtrC family response regulator
VKDPDQPRSVRRCAVGIADRDAERRVLLARGLKERGFDIRTWTSPAAALEGIDALPARAVLLCEAASAGTAMRLHQGVTRQRPDVGLVVLTPLSAAEDVAKAAPGAGLVIWPAELDAVVPRLEAVARRHADERRTAARAAALADELIGDSGVMRRLRENVARVADGEGVVLVTGETGTGKEMVARAIHRASRRRARQLITVNCALVPGDELEAELFGSTRGARRGLLAAAERGMLLLDDIGDLPLDLQPKLLRALDHGAAPVHGEHAEPTRPRLICTSNVDLAEAVAKKRLRADLYFRLSTVQIEVPPLRARGDDVLSLARLFIGREAQRADRHITGMTDDCAERLLAYRWPGNVRELHNAIHHAVTFASSERIAAADLPDVVLAEHGRHRTDDGLITLMELERRHLVRVLLAFGGSHAQAAAVLGLSRAELERKLLQHGVRSDGKPM